MKRVIPQKVMPVVAKEPDNSAMVQMAPTDSSEQMKQTISGTGRASTSAAMIGLAISVVAPGLLVATQSDAALAVEPIVSESTAQPQSVPSTVASISVNSDNKDSQTQLLNPAIQSPNNSKGPKWQGSLLNSLKGGPAPEAGQTNANVSPTSSELAGPIAKTASDGINNESSGTANLSDSKETNLLNQGAETKNSPVGTVENLDQGLGRGEAWPDNQTNNVGALVTEPSLFTDRPTTDMQQTPASGIGVDPSFQTQLDNTANATNDLLAPVAVASGVSSQVMGNTYHVLDGDTLNDIARKYAVSIEELITANQLIDPNVLEVGQEIRIPVAVSGITNNGPTTAQVISNSVTTEVPQLSPELALQQDSTVIPSDSSSNSIPVVGAGDGTQGTEIVTAPTGATPISIPVTAVSSVADTPERANSTTQFQPDVTLLAQTESVPVSVNVDTTNQPQALANLPKANALSVSGSNRTPYANTLRSQLDRLKADQEAHGGQNEVQTSEISQNKNNQGVIVAQQPEPTPAESSAVTIEVPQVSKNNNLRTLQREIATPQIRNQARNLRVKQQEIATYPTQKSDIKVRPNVLTSNIGSNGYDPLMLDRMVSPELPPLSPADTYLPGGTLQHRPGRSFSNGFIWPAQGTLTSGYGWRWGRMHQGIDIASSIGTPIYAAKPGVVEYADWNDGGYGYLVEIKHSDGSKTVYAHNDRILVQEGQQVEQGQQISEMGTTGRSTGPHLHFEIRPDGQGAVDPMAYLPNENSTAQQ